MTITEIQAAAKQLRNQIGKMRADGVAVHKKEAALKYIRDSIELSKEGFIESAAVMLAQAVKIAAKIDA